MTLSINLVAIFVVDTRSSKSKVPSSRTNFANCKLPRLQAVKAAKGCSPHGFVLDKGFAYSTLWYSLIVSQKIIPGSAEACAFSMILFHKSFARTLLNTL